MKIELIDSQIQSAVLTIDDQSYAALPDKRKTNCWYWEVDICDSEIVIEYSPDYINKPRLRIDGFLIDYWTAKIAHSPGHLKFFYNKSFFEYYYKNNLQDRLNSLGSDPSDLTVDRVVGRNLHPELVNKLLETINEKSIVN
jgi:hypothetical protein